MATDTSWSQRPIDRSDLAGVLAASAAWLALMLGPRAFVRGMDPLAAHAAVFGLLAWVLVASAPRVAGSSRAIVLCGLAALAGFAAAPAWIAGIGWLGLELGLSAGAPAPAGAPPLGWLCAVALGPLVEELVYRDRLLRALRPAGAAVAIGATSLLFALSHPSGFPMLAAGCVGIALAVARWRTGSVSICVGYHAGLNAASLACGVPPARRALAPEPAAVAGAVLGAAVVMLARRLARVPRVAALALVVPALAGADVLAFEAELRLEPLASSFPPLSVEGTGVATVNGEGGGIALETLALDGGLDGTATVLVTDPTAGGVTTVEMSALLGAATLRPFQPPAPLTSPQLSLSTLPVRGEIRFCFLFGACDHSLLRLGLDATTVSGAHPGVGVGGIVTAYPVGAIRMSLHAAPWTVRTATLAVETGDGGSFTAFASGTAHGPASFTGSTALTGGELELVTPIRVVSSGGGPSLPIFGRLAIRFIPEPAPALLLGAGGLATALAARRRHARGGIR